MPPKRRGRKPAAAKRTRSRKEKDPAAEEKKSKLSSLLSEFDTNLKNHCNTMKSNLVSACSNIQVLYDMALFTIPTMYHNMTKEQYEERKRTCDVNKTVDNGISQLFNLPSVMSRIESCRATTAKKKQKVKKFTSSASKIQKKLLKDNVNISTASIRTTRRALAQMQETVIPVPRQQVFLQNFTPKVKKSFLFNTPTVVTPKFDPRKPLISSLLRKPRAGEIVMSMSGSPLQLPVVDAAPKPGIMVSFGGGRVLNIADPSGLSEIGMNLDHSTKQTLKLVNEKLSKVLAS